MSYDVSLSVTDSLGYEHELFWVNYTSNLSAAWRAAGINVHLWDGVDAGVAHAELELGIPEIEADLASYKKRYDAPNGWGTVDGMVEHFLKPLKVECERWPNATVMVSR